MSPAELAFLIFILTGFGTFIVTLAWVSRRTTDKNESREPGGASRSIEAAARLSVKGGDAAIQIIRPHFKRELVKTTDGRRD